MLCFCVLCSVYFALNAWCLMLLCFGLCCLVERGCFGFALFAVSTFCALGGWTAHYVVVIFIAVLI